MERLGPGWLKLFWIAAYLVMLTRAESFTTVQPQPQEEPSHPSTSANEFEWSSWGSWTPCSKTCGGGVSMQERQCLPRTRTLLSDDTLPRPVITVRVTREAPSEPCQGEDKRFHECNTAPCGSVSRDPRAEQCASYDWRPFRGRFYTWVPYVDGNSPCILNCRPLGQHFYASLALVADGTPCTKPGSRAICVQGTCKAVGRDSVLASAANPELSCGRRLVSGLFSRPRLPLGYSYVTTVPRGACRLNVSEIIPSDNYIALKITNGSFIMNGEFAVSSPGAYDAAGSRFVYTRKQDLDSVFAHGPIHYPIDIMILYTQPTANIKYEYLTDLGDSGVEAVTRPSIPDILSTAQAKHIRRHRPFDYPRPTISDNHDILFNTNELTNAEDELGENIIGGRRFVWKILSYSPCTRTCGGGIQVGKYRCVESTASGDREISPVHCSGSPPVGRRKRCGNVPCPPRWRAAPWSMCPKCGNATRTRIVGCVQDHSRGIAKVSDAKCPPPKPPTAEPCHIPDCNTYFSRESNYIESRRKKPRDRTDTFRDGPVYTVSVNSTELDVGPEYNLGATAAWLSTDWSECVGWCVGGGIQTRRVRCADPSGCAPRKAPETFRSCSVKSSCDPHEGQWFTGEWSSCSSSCGGKQIRGVLCIGGTGRHIRDTACKTPKPETERDCGGDCPQTWFTSEWDQCIGNCTTGTGIQRRTVWCATSTESASNQAGCTEERPSEIKPCVPKCAPAVSDYTIRPDLISESQTTVSYDTNPPTTTTRTTPNTSTTTTTTTTTTQRSAFNEIDDKDCKDKLPNCFLAVQARLCHYNYYKLNCCSSCKGRV